VPFRRRQNDPEQQRRAEESLRALEAGGIPLAASERLEEFRRRGDRFFTSGLSVNELALSREAGFRPLTQVMGSCFYRTGWQTYPWAGVGGAAAGFGAGVGAGQTFELEQQTSAWNEARRLALARLSEEARGAGADAVVGVKLWRRHHDWAAGVIEFVVVGTAVRSERYELGDEPALSNLSGQDFSKLFRHGFWPVGLVAGSTVAYVASGWTQQLSSGWGAARLRNQEMPDYTQGIYDARALAMARLTRQAHELHGHGVVGVVLDRSQREVERRGSNTNWNDLIIEMHILGTAVIEVERAEPPPGTYLSLQLNDQEAT
jgi:uncharacterized protein YbjQ (UPF0145 family)